MEKEDASKDYDKKSHYQPIGFVPLFPPIEAVSPRNQQRNYYSNNSGFGFTYFPPIYPQHRNLDNLLFSDRHILLVAEELLNEVFLEELLDCVKHLLTNGVNPSVEALIRNISENNKFLNQLAEEILYDTIIPVVAIECDNLAKEFFDDIIVGHKLRHAATKTANEMIAEVISESLLDVYNDVVTQEYAELELFPIIQEVTSEETEKIALDVLNHYGARIAFQQYKSLTSFASEYFIDFCYMDTLLPFPPTDNDIAEDVLDGIVFDVLIDQLVTLNSAFDESCLPMQWFLKTLIYDVMLEKSLQDLCNELDMLSFEE